MRLLSYFPSDEDDATHGGGGYYLCPSNTGSDDVMVAQL